MNHWQDIVTVALIVAAAAYLARILWCRCVKNTGRTCSSFPGCSPSSDAKKEHSGSPPLHDLESSTRK